jgi:predicted phage terminase large subunit-like protein
MAYINGEWLARDKRQERINRLEALDAKFTGLKASGNITEHLMRQWLGIKQELRKLQRVHRAEHDMMYFMLEYFSADGNPENGDNLIPKGVNYENSADFHRTLCGLLDQITNGEQDGNVAWSVGRGHAKTAYLSNGYLCHQVAFRHKKYIVEVSETTDVAGDFISWTRNQLKFNRKLIEDFGVLLHEQKAKNDVDNNVEFVTTSGTKVEAKGIGTQVRGLRHGSTRPDLFLLDDLESKDNTNTPELIEKNMKWFKEELLPGLSRDGGLCIYMGTIVCFDSLLDYVIKKRKDFTSRKFPAVLSWAERDDLWAIWQSIYRSDDAEAGVKAKAYFNAHKEEMLKGTEVLWEALFSYYDLMVLREENGIKAFNQEYLGNPTDEERQIFKPEHFVYFSPADLDNKEFTYYCGIDFAMGKEKGDYSVIATLAKNKATSVCYVVDVYMERVHPDILLQEAVKRTLQYQYEIVAIETQMAQEFFADVLSKELVKHGYPAHTRLKHIKQRTRKGLRIEALLPDIQNGKLRFNKSMRALLEQFEMYPMHKHDDGPDAVQMAYDASKSGAVTIKVSKKRTR